MAKRKSYKSIEGLNKKLQSQLQSSKTNNINDRVSTLEKELKDSITLAMSMIAVNKELINRLQEEQQTGTASRTTGTGRVSDQDTSADILGKIFNFFVKGSERDRRNFELQRDFAQERAMESKRRKPFGRKSVTKLDPKKPSSNPIMDLLSFIGKGIGNIFKFITGGLFGFIGKGLQGIKDFFMNIPGIGFLGKILGIIKDFGVGAFKSLFGLLSWSTSLVGWLGTLGVKISKIVFSVLTGSAKILFKLVWPLIKRVLGGLVSKLLSFIPGFDASAAEATGTAAIEEATAAAGVESNVIGGSIALPAAAVAGAVGGGMVGSYLADKSDIFRYGKEWSDLRDKRNDIQQQISDLDKQVLSPEKKQKKKQELEAQLEPLKGQMLDAVKKHHKDVVVPAMMEQGYEPKFQDGKEGFFKKGGYNGPEGQHVDDEFITFVDTGKQKEEGVIGKLKSISDYPGSQMDALKITKIAANYMIKKQTDKVKEGVATLSDPDKMMEMVRGSDTYKSMVSDAESDIGAPPSATPVSPSTRGDTSASTSEHISAPAPESSPTATPAPLEQRESDSASITPDTTQPSMVTPAPKPVTPMPSLSNMSDHVDVGRTEVVNMPTQTNTAVSESEFDGTPNVRNPNPIVYRTAMRNDQAQP